MIASYIPARLADREGWAADIHAALATLEQPSTPDTLCAVVAVTEKESGFQVDPAVPNLGAIARKEIDRQREHLGIPRLVLEAALALPSNGARTQALDLLVPPEHAEAFLGEARGRCADWRVGLHGITVRHTLAEDETFLCWARREYAAVSLAVEQLPTLGGAVRTTQLRRELIAASIACGGSFAIDRTPDATREQVEACYPQLKALLAEKRRMDPEAKISNGWYRHHRSLLARESCAVRWNR